jgi:integrase
LGHHRAWGQYRLRARRRGEAAARLLTLAEWATQTVPYSDEPPQCLVGGCGGMAHNLRRLCALHLKAWQLWRRESRPAAEDGTRGGPVLAGDLRRTLSATEEAALAAQIRRWAGEQTPVLSVERFSLQPLAPLMRWETLFALQRLDRNGRRLVPTDMRRIVRALTTHAATGTARASLLDERCEPAAELLGTRGHRGQAPGTLIELRWAVRVGFDEFTGADAAAKPVLDLRVVGVRSDYTITHRRRLGGTADLTTISQDWLRRLLARWAELEHPGSGDFTQTLKAARFASQALAARPGGGQDPATLRHTDMSAVLDHIWAQTHPDGRAYARSTPNNWQWKLFALLDYGTRAGLLDDLAVGFVQDRASHNRHDRRRGRTHEVNESELGKAIPEPVIAQLDAQLDRLGPPDPGTGTGDSVRAGGPAAPGIGLLTPGDLRALYQTAYVLLRDTGRRPGEIAGLRRDCLEQTGDEHTLIYDNRKAGRLGRRLPITAATAAVIRAWQTHRARLIDIPARSRDYLFPALTDLARADHFPTVSLWAAIRAWVDGLPELWADGLDPRGNRLPFDRTKIYPYAFRHSYAQRHADAGTPIDVLRDLMDHKSMQTTQGYYTVSLARRRDAVTTLAAQVITRDGRLAPCSTQAYELRSVAVPFGGCTEPANVKAGGGACPIRFQCAGCGFYRPDPSYLHAIEQHVHDLRANLETARALDAADYITAAMTAEIGAYQAVAATMRTRLAELPADERAEIEHAATVLRKIRAGHTPPLTITPTGQTGPGQR